MSRVIILREFYCLYCALLDAVEITNTMHKFAPLLYSYTLALMCFGSSLPSSGSFWIRLSFVKIQVDMVVYHVTLVKWPVCRIVMVQCVVLPS
jgi:hypothetical protein